ncbi:MAG: hypothetical protein HC895_11030 [Leptolyngbyaceae cyanobacterium SM1_3_5]|nr:hypothetical protein [Leptolyngbyaceae cyanobacterium SM1_3_5]
MAQRRQIIKTFSSREAAGQAFDHLILSGLPIAQIFLLGDGLEKFPHSQLSANNYGAVTGTATGLKKGFMIGNLAGSATGLLLGAGLLALPGVGTVALSSAIAFVLLSGGICTAAGGLTGALIGLGLTSEQVKTCQQQISSGSVLLIVEGTNEEIDRAKSLLNALVY